MTDKPRAVDPEVTGPTPGESAPGGQSEEKPSPRVVIRDKRKLGKVDRDGAGSAADATATPAADDATDDATGGVTAQGLVQDAEVAVDEVGESPVLDGPTPAGPPVVDAPAEPVEEGVEGTSAAETSLTAKLDALRAELDERTRDLQRVTAEYANYRKRIDRDRGVVAEQATGMVLAALLPILDDLDRAREHGDLVGPFGSVAEQLTAALGKFGLIAFGEQGDPFDPTRHEAVAHQTSADVTEPTCVEVMRRGYLLGERLLRAALVAVADPE